MEIHGEYVNTRKSEGRHADEHERLMNMVDLSRMTVLRLSSRPITIVTSERQRESDCE